MAQFALIWNTQHWNLSKMCAEFEKELVANWLKLIVGCLCEISWMGPDTRPGSWKGSLIRRNVLNVIVILQTKLTIISECRTGLHIHWLLWVLSAKKTITLHNFFLTILPFKNPAPDQRQFLWLPWYASRRHSSSRHSLHSSTHLANCKWTHLIFINYQQFW